VPCRNRRLAGLGAASTQPQVTSSGLITLSDSVRAAIGVVDVLAQDFIRAHAAGNRPAASAALRTFQSNYNARRSDLAIAHDFLIQGGLPGPLLVDGVWGPASHLAMKHTMSVQAVIDTSPVAAYAWANQMPVVGASGAAYASWITARPVLTDFGPPPAAAPGAPAVSPDTSGSSGGGGGGGGGGAQVTQLPLAIITGSRTAPGAQWPWYVGLGAAGVFGLWLAYNRFRR